MNRSDTGLRNSASPCYQSVIRKVIENCREAFLDEGMDEHILQELKHLWVEKLKASRVIEPVGYRRIYKKRRFYGDF